MTITKGKVQIVLALAGTLMLPMSLLAQAPDPNYDPQAQGAQQGPPPPQDPQAAYNQGYQDGMASVTQAPPAIPQYDQPEAPGDGYIWTPGYWAWGPAGYYWVPGAWVEAPYAGALWTPGYWGFDGGYYFWNAGYWGPVVGYYGGVNYGFGYFGVGFYGGYWAGGRFFYNTAYWHVGPRIHNVYVVRAPEGVERVHPGGVSFTATNGGHAPGYVARGGTFNTRGQAYAERGGAQVQSRPAQAGQNQYRLSPNTAPEYRPAPNAAPQNRPNQNAAPEYRPAPNTAPQYRPAPAPEYRQNPAPAPQYRPAPAPAPRTAPAPAPAPRTVPKEEKR